MIEDGLSTYIGSAPTYKAISSAQPYPLVLPEPVPAGAALTYQVVSGDPDSTMDGPSGFVEYRIQYDAWAYVYGAAKALQEAVRLLLDGYTGTLPDGTVVFNIMADDAADLYEPVSKLYRSRTDFKVQFSR